MIIVGIYKNEIYKRENLVGPFLVHKILGPGLTPENSGLPPTHGPVQASYTCAGVAGTGLVPAHAPVPPSSGATKSPFWFAGHLLIVTHKSPLLHSVLQSVILNGRSLLLTALLTIIVVYLFIVVGYVFFEEDFVGADSTRSRPHPWHFPGAPMVTLVCTRVATK